MLEKHADFSGEQEEIEDWNNYENYDLMPY